MKAHPNKAERQKRFRERRRADPLGVAALSADERAARDAVSATGLMSMSAIFSNCEARVVRHRPTSATHFAPAPARVSLSE